MKRRRHGGEHDTNDKPRTAKRRRQSRWLIRKEDVHGHVTVDHVLDAIVELYSLFPGMTYGQYVPRDVWRRIWHYCNADGERGYLALAILEPFESIPPSSSSWCHTRTMIRNLAYALRSIRSQLCTQVRMLKMIDTNCLSRLQWYTSLHLDGRITLDYAWSMYMVPGIYMKRAFANGHRKLTRWLIAHLFHQPKYEHSAVYDKWRGRHKDCHLPKTACHWLLAHGYHETFINLHTAGLRKDIRIAQCVTTLVCTDKRCICSRAFHMDIIEAQVRRVAKPSSVPEKLDGRDTDQFNAWRLEAIEQNYPKAITESFLWNSLYSAIHHNASLQFKNALKARLRKMVNK